MIPTRDLPPLEVVTLEEVPTQAASALAVRFASEPALVFARRRYADHHDETLFEEPGAIRGEDFRGGPHYYGPLYRRFALGGARFELVTARDGHEIVGSGEALLLMWRVRDGEPERALLVERPDNLLPTLATDLDGDGLPELVQHGPFSGDLRSRTVRLATPLDTAGQYID